MFAPPILLAALERADDRRRLLSRVLASLEELPLGRDRFEAEAWTVRRRLELEELTRAVWGAWKAGEVTAEEGAAALFAASPEALGALPS